MPLARNEQQHKKITKKYKRIDSTQKRIAEKNKDQVVLQFFLI
jgi:spore maturation protein CgeB